jgi:hypothetical protein
MTQLRITYKIREFGDLIGKNYWQTRRIITKLNIPIHSTTVTGRRKWYIYLSDIQNMAPDLFHSLFIMRQLQNDDLVLPSPAPQGRKRKLINPLQPEPPQPPFQRKFGNRNEK